MYRRRNHFTNGSTILKRYLQCTVMVMLDLKAFLRINFMKPKAFFIFIHFFTNGPINLKRYLKCHVYRKMVMLDLKAFLRIKFYETQSFFQSHFWNHFEAAAQSHFSFHKGISSHVNNLWFCVWERKKPFHSPWKKTNIFFSPLNPRAINSEIRHSR